jgi:hypothetical protein
MSRKELFKGGSEWIRELFFYFFSVPIEAGKGLGFKGILFAVPVIIGIILVVLYIIKIVV